MLTERDHPTIYISPTSLNRQMISACTQQRISVFLWRHQLCTVDNDSV